MMFAAAHGSVLVKDRRRRVVARSSVWAVRPNGFEAFTDQEYPMKETRPAGRRSVLTALPLGLKSLGYECNRATDKRRSRRLPNYFLLNPQRLRTCMICPAHVA